VRPSRARRAWPRRSRPSCPCATAASGLIATGQRPPRRTDHVVDVDLTERAGPGTHQRSGALRAENLVDHDAMATAGGPIQVTPRSLIVAGESAFWSRSSSPVHAVETGLIDHTRWRQV